MKASIKIRTQLHADLSYAVETLSLKGFEQEFRDEDIGSSVYRWNIHTTDSCGIQRVSNTRQLQLTNDGYPPCCTPGGFAFPKENDHRVCQSKDSLIPDHPAGPSHCSVDSPSPAPTPTPTQFSGTLKSAFTGLCVDIPGGDTSDGALLWAWDCYGGEAQQWAFQDGMLKSLLDTSKCVDLLGGDTTNGNQLGLWSCYGGDSQQWGFDPDMGTIYLASSAASDATKCVQFGGGNQGDPLTIWDCAEVGEVWSVGSSFAVV